MGPGLPLRCSGLASSMGSGSEGSGRRDVSMVCFMVVSEMRCCWTSLSLTGTRSSSPPAKPASSNRRSNSSSAESLPICSQKAMYDLKRLRLRSSLLWILLDELDVSVTFWVYLSLMARLAWELRTLPGDFKRGTQSARHRGGSRIIMSSAWMRACVGRSRR